MCRGDSRLCSGEERTAAAVVGACAEASRSSPSANRRLRLAAARDGAACLFRRCLFRRCWFLLLEDDACSLMRGRDGCRGDLRWIVVIVIPRMPPQKEERCSCQRASVCQGQI